VDKTEIIRRLQASRQDWEPLGAERLFLFGSAARGEARPGSDVDLLVDLARPVTLFEFSRLRRCLTEVLGRPVDLVTRAAVKPKFRDRILAEAIRAA
jgi:hypothetical protein